MTPADDAADRLRSLIAAAEADPAEPDLARVWAAFRRFSAEAFAAETSEVWFEAGAGDPPYLDFVRLFNLSDGESDWQEMVSAYLTGPPGAGLGTRGAIHADLDDLPAWFRAVESSPAFSAALAYRGWRFEARIDGC